MADLNLIVNVQMDQTYLNDHGQLTLRYILLLLSATDYFTRNVMGRRGWRQEDLRRLQLSIGKIGRKLEGKANQSGARFL